MATQTVDKTYEKDLTASSTVANPLNASELPYNEEDIRSARFDDNNTPETSPSSSLSTTLTQDFTLTINNKTYNIIAEENGDKVTFRLPDKSKNDVTAQFLCCFLNEATAVSEIRTKFILGKYQEAFFDATSCCYSNVVEAYNNFNDSFGESLKKIEFAPTPYKTSYEDGEVPTVDTLEKLHARTVALEEKYRRLSKEATDAMMYHNDFNKLVTTNEAASKVYEQYENATEAYRVANEAFNNSTGRNRQAFTH